MSVDRYFVFYRNSKQRISRKCLSTTSIWIPRIYKSSNSKEWICSIWVCNVHVNNTFDTTVMLWCCDVFQLDFYCVYIDGEKCERKSNLRSFVQFAIFTIGVPFNSRELWIQCYYHINITPDVKSRRFYKITFPETKSEYCCTPMAK